MIHSLHCTIHNNTINLQIYASTGISIQNRQAILQRWVKNDGDSVTSNQTGDGDSVTLNQTGDGDSVTLVRS